MEGVIDEMLFPCPLTVNVLTFPPNKEVITSLTNEWLGSYMNMASLMFPSLVTACELWKLKQ